MSNTILFDEKRLFDYFKQQSEQHNDKYGEIIANYNKLAMESVKTRNSIQDEVSKNFSVAMKEVKDKMKEESRQSEDEYRKTNDEKIKLQDQLNLLTKEKIESLKKLEDKDN